MSHAKRNGISKKPRGTWTTDERREALEDYAKKYHSTCIDRILYVSSITEQGPGGRGYTMPFDYGYMSTGRSTETTVCGLDLSYTPMSVRVIHPGAIYRGMDILSFGPMACGWWPNYSEYRTHEDEPPASIIAELLVNYPVIPWGWSPAPRGRFQVHVLGDSKPVDDHHDVEWSIQVMHRLWTLDVGGREVIDRAGVSTSMFVDEGRYVRRPGT